VVLQVPREIALEVVTNPDLEGVNVRIYTGFVKVLEFVAQNFCAHEHFFGNRKFIAKAVEIPVVIAKCCGRCAHPTRRGIGQATTQFATGTKFQMGRRVDFAVATRQLVAS
jgi:hypothetical protein